MSTQTSASNEQKRVSLRTNFSWTFFSNIIYAGTQWGLLILLTKLFAPEVFGSYALTLSIVTPIFVGSAMQLRAVQITDIKEVNCFADYILLRIITNLLALLGILIITLLGLMPAHLFILACLLGLNQAVLLIKDIYNGAMQQHGRMDLVAISTILMGTISLIAVALAAFLTHSIFWVAVSNVAAGIVSVVFFDISQVRVLTRVVSLQEAVSNIRSSLQFSRLLSLARIAFPLGIVILLISLYSNIPRYFIARTGEVNVGFFAAISSLVAIQELITGALGQSTVPILARYYISNKKAYIWLVARLVFIFMAIGIAGVVVALSLGSQILSLIFRPEYVRFADIFIWLLIAKVVLNAKSALGYSTTAARIFNSQIWIESLNVATLCILAWFFIPKWGGLGAAWAILGSALVSLAAIIAVLLTALKNKVDDA